MIRIQRPKRYRWRRTFSTGIWPAPNEFASRTPLVNPRNGVIIGIVAEKSATP